MRAVNLLHPLADITGSSAHGDVLRTLIRAVEPLTGREIARRAGRSARGASLVLEALVDSGMVIRRSHPPAILYRLNEEHVAVPALRALDGVWPTQLLSLLRDIVDAWEVQPHGVAVFGSLARGEAGPKSDIDLIVLRRSEVPPGSATWEAQLSGLERRIESATGNPTRILEYEATELDDAGALRRELLRDALHVSGERLRDVLLPTALLG